MTHRSKISTSLVVFLSLAMLGPIYPVFITEGWSYSFVLYLAIIAALYAWIVHMLFNTTHTIDNHTLRIKVGFITYPSVDIMDMKSISKSSSWLSSPAASFDRIAIKHGKYKKLIISPEDKLKFAQDMQSINPDISINIPNQ